MSWTASLSEALAASEIAADKFATSPPELDGGPKEQFELAVAKAKAIASSGAVGNDSKSFYINLSGHANADHEPAKGWANDAITVSVSQK